MRKFSKLIGVFLIVMLIVLTIGGCSSSSNTPTTSSAIAPVASSSTTTNTLTTSSATSQTLKIGVVCDFEDGLEIDTLHTIEALADMDNSSGGIQVGGTTYKIQLVEYDSGGKQTGETAAVNKLVFQDKVKFIVGAGRYMSSWLPTTESNKVIVDMADNNFKENDDPALHYSFDGGSSTTSTPVVAGWISQNFPNIKNMVFASTDDDFGHIMVQVFGPVWDLFGVKTTDIYYPANSTDLSAMATKVVSLNPDAFLGMGYGDVGNGNTYKAVAEAGYHGQFISPITLPVKTLLTLMTPAQLEGMVADALPTEFNPPLTPFATKFENYWVSKHGSWTNPNIVEDGVYCSLIAALQKAGSLDSDAVAAAFENLQYDTPMGPEQMISRPDIGNNRTIDSLPTVYIKQIKGGEANLLATISPNDGLAFFRKAFPPMSTSSTSP